MEREYTYSEIAGIFSAIAKAQERLAEYNDRDNDYKGAEADYDAGKPGAAIRMLDAYHERENAEKAYKRAAKKVVGALGLDVKNYEDFDMMRWSTSIYRADAFLYCAGNRAKEIVKMM